MDDLYGDDEAYLGVQFEDSAEAIFPIGWLVEHAAAVGAINATLDRQAASHASGTAAAPIPAVGLARSNLLGTSQPEPVKVQVQVQVQGYEQGQAGGTSSVVQLIVPVGGTDYGRGQVRLADRALAIEGGEPASDTRSKAPASNTSSVTSDDGSSAGASSRASIHRALEAFQSSHGAATPHLWTACDWGETPDEQAGSLRRHRLEDVLRHRGAAMAWLGDARALGFALLRDVPDVDGAVTEVCELFGPVRETVPYGRSFQVRQEKVAWNMTFNSAGLDPHTDNPYRDPTPSIQLLHCRQQAWAGGETTLVDGFAAAEALREADPEGFRLLSKYPACFEFVKGAGFKQGGMQLHQREAERRATSGGSDSQSRSLLGVDLGEGNNGGSWCTGTRLRDTSCHLFARKRLIETDEDGRITGVTFNCRTMGPAEVPSRLLDGWMRAYSRFSDICNDLSRALCFRLQPGDLYLVDNRRVLHGRLPFRSPEDEDGSGRVEDGGVGGEGGGVRHLEGCYGDMDALNSLHRVLSTQVGTGRT